MQVTGWLAGQAAVVTGGAQGLGEALCHRLAREGCAVVVADIDLERAQAVAEGLRAEGCDETLAVQVDVCDPDQCEQMAERTLQRFSRLDLLVANAGIVAAGGVEEIDPARWRRVIDVNLVGYFHSARAAAKVMMRRRAGNIIQINSKSGKKGSFKNSAYAASKFGGIGLTQSLALELAPYGVRVNAICPGNLLDSPLWMGQLYAEYAQRWGISEEEVRRRYEGQVPLGRGCTYEDVANVLVFLASDEASYMTGQAINVTGGQEMR